MLRPANEKDLPSIMAIIAQAQRYLAAQGVDQWQDGYPSEAVMRADIAEGTAYVFERDGVVCGIATLVLTGEPTYQRIEQGAWTTPEKYGCIHRIAVDAAMRGKGVAGALMQALEARAIACGMQGMRIDTHHDNHVMQGMLAKCGYTPCGVIYLASGAPRMALEKRL